MSSDTKRLFVGNLPDGTSEQALQIEFENYGVVRTVEVKQQKDIDTGEIKSTFAFVTISIDDRTLDQCLREFKQEKYRGRFLKVTVARENFLDKLKREREEAAELKSVKNAQNARRKNDSGEVKPILPTFTAKSDVKSSSESSDDNSSEEEQVVTPQKPTEANGVKWRQSSSSSSDSSDSDADENELVLRKKSKIFLENGKIKIDRNVSGGDAIHVIERSASKSAKKSLDEKSQKADQKRIESLKKMKNSYEEQKLAIKNALAGIDTTKRNNKIVFGDVDDDEIGESSTSAKKTTPTRTPMDKSTKKPILFADDDDDEEDEQNYQKDFQIKEQFQGAKGERLMRLQSRFQNDRRFNMDAKFLEDEENDGDYDGHRNSPNSHEAKEEDGDDERQWQYDILESVIGKKVRHNEPQKDPTRKKAPPSMLRFDPTRADHTKFVENAKKRPKKLDKDVLNAKRRKMDEGDEQYEDDPPVSKEQFYEIHGDLKKSMGSGNFSLLSMFGRTGDDASTTKTAEIDSKYEEKLIARNSAKFLTDLDPFKYDSSGDEADDETKSKQKTKRSEGAADENKTTNNGSIRHETFFIHSPNDERRSEGIAFFLRADDGEQPHEIDETKKQELRNIVKRKIKKSVKNALPRHVKPNKRFQRFTKNL